MNNQKKNQQSNKKTNNSKKKNKDAVVSETDIISYSPPRINRQNDFRIKKKEFIQNVPSASSFTVNTIECNPGLEGMFPWLSQIAMSFEKYEFHEIRFYFETSQSTFVPGTISFAPEFNVADEPPVSKSELFEYAFVKRSPVWKNFSQNYPKKAVMNFKEYYTRNSEPTGNSDKKLYDPFYLIIAVDGVPDTAGSFIGELWVEYDVSLTLPQKLRPSILDLSNTYQVQLNGAEAGAEGSFLGTDIVQSYGDFPIVFDFDLNKITFTTGFEGLWVIYIIGTEAGQVEDWLNILDEALLDNVTVIKQYGTRGQNLELTSGQVEYSMSISAEAGGSIIVANNGYNSEIPSLGSLHMFWNEVAQQINFT